MNKKTLIILLALLFLSSCSLFQKNDTEQTPTLQDTKQQEIIIEEQKEEGVIENTTNIVNEYYTETLPNSIKDARDVVNDINSKNEIYKDLDSLR